MQAECKTRVGKRTLLALYEHLIISGICMASVGKQTFALQNHLTHARVRTLHTCKIRFLAPSEMHGERKRTVQRAIALID